MLADRKSAVPVEDIARALAGGAVHAIRQVGGGRNSRVYRVEAETGTFALKQYPSRTDDPRDRLGTEAAALRWMEANGLAMVPRLIASDRDNNFSLLSWAEGALVRDVCAGDIDQAADFLGRLHGLRRTPAIPVSHLATEACLSGAEIERQIRARVSHLLALEGDAALSQFIHAKFLPALDARLGDARLILSAAKIRFGGELLQELRSLVPSDFGFHNALRAEGGALTFIDFEYFGWDDPVKLTADIIMHPGTPVAPALRARFRAAAELLYGSDPEFAARLRAYYPLFGLRWVLILLNEFHPERWRRRVLAGAGESWEQAKHRQLQAARDMLALFAN